MTGLTRDTNFHPGRVWVFFMLLYCGTCPGMDIIFQSTPDAGIQPVLVSDQDGGIHLIYFKVEDESTGHGRLYYRRFVETDQAWSAAVRVSTNPYPRPHLIARAAMAVDHGLRLHVTWHQDYPADQFPTPNSEEYLPDYFYTRSGVNDAVFEPERSVVREFITEAETGAALVVNDDTVSLIWHGSGPDAAEMESEGSVYMSTSSDNGVSFGKEKLVGDQSLGACGCCGLAAGFDRRQRLQVAYRTAVANTGRHIQLLEVEPGKTGKTRLIHSWQLNACPVSTSHMARDGHGNNHLVFESQGLVYMADLDGVDTPPRPLRSRETGRAQKHPVIAVNKSNEILVAWDEGPGINGGGVLRWQLFDPEGKPVMPVDREERVVAEHSAPAVAPLRDGSFLLLY